MMSSPPVRMRPGSPPAEKTLRALVTRPRSEAQALAALLAERGIEVIVEPMIEIAERGAALPALSGVQAILLTSANGARALAKATSERAAAVFVVGDATARAAR